ncbi:neuromedin Bb [Poeciliopsis prolifica]|uniref:neuromedin Bb n=1 Tax=Poeciliopsis prolifica TaxID=188132 RepID=UPI00241371BE|nr:neuromedin Bb [Poeciliopsis prolifica]
MRGLTLTNVCHCGFFTYLVFMYLSAGDSISLTERGSKVPKFKVTPKGNLWATGHFMGKKSVMETPLLRSLEDQQGVNALDASLPAEQTSLFQEFLRVALKAQMDTEESRLKEQEAELLAKILVN